MKKIIFIALAVLTLLSCKEDEAPYYGYAAFDNNQSKSRIIVDQPEGSSSIQLKTDISSGTVMPREGSEWCSGSVDGKGMLTLHYAANTESSTRTGFVDMVFGLHKITLQVIQRTTGTNHVEILNPNEGDPLRWSATCSDIQTSEGTLDNIFNDAQNKFWHSQYSPNVPLPHWIIVDLKKEMDINQVRLGWRMNGANVYIHVRKAEMLYSNDGTNFTSTGGIIFREPVDGKMSSPNYEPYTDCPFATVKARYIKVNMTESNDAGGVCHIAYFKVFAP